MNQQNLSSLSALVPLPNQSSHFTAVVSNPPYQMASLDSSHIEGRDTEVVNVFQHFYEISTIVSAHSTMIFPGGRWMQRSHGNNSISNLIFSTVHKILWFPNGEEKRITPIFEHAAISDGVSIVHFSEDLQNSSKIFVNRYELDRPEDKEIVPLSAEANSIISKLDRFENLNSRKLDTNIFKLGTNWVENNAEQVVEYEQKDIDFDNEVIAYLGNTTHGKNKRVQKYLLRKESVVWSPRLEKIYGSWKIVCSQGQVSKRPATSSYRILEKDTVVGASWMILGTFKTLDEAINYKKYIDTDFVRFLIEESRGGKSGKWGIFVPDLADYTASNPKIDWSKNLDEQLFDMFELDDEQRRIISSKNFHWKDKEYIL